MKKKDKVSVNYSFFRDYNLQILILLPFLSGMLVYYLSDSNFVISDSVVDINLLLEIQIISIGQFLLGYKTAMILIFAFMINFKWSQIQKTRAYGFWIANGVSRSSFLSYLLFKTTLLILVSCTLGLLLLSIASGYNPSITTIISFIFLISISLLTWLSISLLLAELAWQPEIGVIAYLGLYLVYELRYFSSDNYLTKVLSIERYFSETGIFTQAVATVLIGAFAITMTHLIHQRRELDL